VCVWRGARATSLGTNRGSVQSYPVADTPSLAVVYNARPLPHATILRLPLFVQETTCSPQAFARPDMLVASRKVDPLEYLATGKR